MMRIRHRAATWRFAQEVCRISIAVKATVRKVNRTRERVKLSVSQWSVCKISPHRIYRTSIDIVHPTVQVSKRKIVR